MPQLGGLLKSVFWVLLPSALTTDEEVIKMRRLVAEGVSQTELAKRFGAALITVSKAVTGESYKHLPSAVQKRPRKNPEYYQDLQEKVDGEGTIELTDESVAEMFRMHREEGVTKRELGILYGLNYANISDILTGKWWGHILRKLKLEKIAAKLEPTPPVTVEEAKAAVKAVIDSMGFHNAEGTIADAGNSIS